MQWELITDLILGAAIAIFIVFVILALYQWISRQKFTKIDPELRWASLPIILMVVTYFLFDKFLVLNTRPNGSGESSFPSSHVMIVTTIFFLAALVLPRYIKSKTTLIILDVVMLILTVLVAVGRVLANMHWVSDVIGAFIFAAIFALIYYLIIRRIRHV